MNNKIIVANDKLYLKLKVSINSIYYYFLLD